MDVEGIARVGPADRTLAVRRNSDPASRRRWKDDAIPGPEPLPEGENAAVEQEEFSAIDPEIGAILAQVDWELCPHIAHRIRLLLTA